MTSVVRSVMSLGLDGIGLTKDSIDEVLSPAEPRFENVQDCRYGLWQLTGIGCLLGRASSWVLDRSAQPAQMQDPGGDGRGAADGHPSG